MARNYANIVCAIWRPGSDFRLLSAAAQRVFVMLFSQADISAAGVLSIRLTRWASNAPDTKPDDVRHAMAELADRQYVVIDEDTEEILIRSFVRWDGGANNGKRRPVILRAAAEVESPILRAALAGEFRRLGLPTDGLSDGASGTPSGPVPPTQPRLPLSTEDPESVDNSPHPVDNSAGSANAQANNPSDTPSHGLPDTPPDRPYQSDGVVVTQGLYYGPQPTTHNLHPRGTAAPPAAGPAVDRPEGEGNPDPVDALTAQVRDIRPEWSPRSIRRALTDPDITTRPWPAITAAMLTVAHDRTSTAPGRIKGDGPWWATTTPNGLSAPGPGRDTRTIPAAAQCPTHRGQPADNCGPCRADKLAAPDHDAHQPAA